MPDNIAYTHDINETQQEQDISALQAGLEAPTTQALPEEQYASLKGWFSRKIVKEAATPEKPAKSVSDMLLRYGQEPMTPEEVVSTKQLDTREVVTDPLVPQPTNFQAKKEALHLRESDLNDFPTTNSWQMNFDTIEQPDDVKSIIAVMADSNRVNIDEARRGIIGDEQLRGLSDDLGKDPEFIRKVLQREDGTLLSAEEILATRQVLEQSAVRLKELAVEMNDPNVGDITKAQFAKQYHFHTAFFQQFMGARAEYGRGMRAMGIPTGGNIDSALAEEITNQATMMNRGLDINSIAQQIAVADSTKGITAVVESTAPSAMAKTFDSMYEVFINGILSGVSTHIVNTAGSAIRIGVDIVDTTVASVMGGKGIDDFDRIGMSEWKAKLFAESTGFREAWDVSWKVMKTADPYGGIDRFDAPMRKAISAENYGIDQGSFLGQSIDALGTVLRSPTERLMGGADAFMKKTAERGAIVQQAYRRAEAMARQHDWDADKTQEFFNNLMKNPTAEMIDIAKTDGLKMTFQEPLGKTGQTFQKWAQTTPSARWVFPFIKTPANMLKQAYLERTPLGLFAKQYREDVMAGGARGQMARSKMATGTALAYMGYQMAINGTITGSDPTDRDVRQKKHEAGWRPRSVVVDTPFGKEYISYDRMEPFSYIVGAMADVATYQEATKYTVLGEEDEKVIERMMDSMLIAVAENTLNKTFMTGMRDLMNVWSEPGRYASRWAKRQADSMLPFSGLRRNIKRTVSDDRTVQADEIGEFFYDQWNMISSNLPKTVDAFGNEVQYDKVLSPWGVSMETRSTSYREVMRLAESTKRSAVPEMGQMMNGFKLTNKEYVEIKKFSRKEQVVNGKNFIDTIADLIESDIYNELIDDHKVEAIRTVTIRFDTAAKAHARTSSVLLYNKAIQKDLIMPAKYKAKNEGISEEDALIQLKEEYNR